MSSEPLSAADRLNSVRALHEFARRIRGEFLEATAWFEVLLTDIVAQYFCPNKARRLLFFSEVANGMNFRSKTELLSKILEHEFPDLLQRYGGLKKRLDKLRDFRNMLAHNPQ